MSLEPAQVVAFPEAEVGLLDAYLRGLPSESTRTVYKRALKAFDRFIGVKERLAATRRNVEAYRAHLEALGRAPSTICQHLSALTGFYDYAMDEGVIDNNPAARARRPKLPKRSNRRGTEVHETQAILEVCCISAAALIDLRDCALVTVLALQAWRIEEALGLTVEDLGEEQGHKVAEITGKGAREDRVALAAATWSAVNDWLGVAGITTGPVFVPVLKGGRVVPGRAISKQAAWKRVKRLAAHAGLRHIHPHLFRHGAITAVLDAQVPLREAQDFARHADPRTTRRYDSHRESLNNPAPHVLAGKLAIRPEGGRGS